MTARKSHVTLCRTQLRHDGFASSHWLVECWLDLPRGSFGVGMSRWGCQDGRCLTFIFRRLQVLHPVLVFGKRLLEALVGDRGVPTGEDWCEDIVMPQKRQFVPVRDDKQLHSSRQGIDRSLRLRRDAKLVRVEKNCM